MRREDFSVTSPGVPTYQARTYHPVKHACVLIIPVINEGQRIRRQLADMSRAALGVDVVLVDGGSTDGSLDEQFLRDTGVRTHLMCEKGLSSQLRAGFHFALESGYRGIVTIDGNGKDSWWHIPNFVAALSAGFDFVQGSRYVSGGEAINTPLDRSIAVRLVHAPILSLAARFRYTDTTNGFRAFSREFLLDDRVRPFRHIFRTYNLHYYLSIRAPRLGYRVIEIPVMRRYPPTGKTPTKISGLKGKLLVLKQLLVASVGGYNP